MKTSQRALVAPLEGAPFSLKTIRDSIPAHCWERSALRSSWYAMRDLFFAGLMLAVVAPAIAAVTGGWLAGAVQAFLWLVFAAVQGTILTGVWVVAHEAGHGSFSESETINNVAGLVLHTILLVPFFSWKFTHAAHHGATNHLRKDQVFVPPNRAEAVIDRHWYDSLEDAPLWNLFFAFRMFVLGWPAYLLLNTSGQAADGFSSHFLPKSKIFKPTQRIWVSLSNWALVGMVGLLSIWINRLGFVHFATRYGLPYLFVNAWLIFYTFMQHTDLKLPHYEAKEWNFVRGALATIDRPYHMFDFFHHEIGTSHVLHHFFSRIPHYHAAEATQAIKGVLKEYYNYDDRNVFAAFWQEYVNCKFVDADAGASDGILWFKRSFKQIEKSK